MKNQVSAIPQPTKLFSKHKALKTQLAKSKVIPVFVSNRSLFNTKNWKPKNFCMKHIILKIPWFLYKGCSISMWAKDIVEKHCYHCGALHSCNLRSSKGTISSGFLRSEYFFIYLSYLSSIHEKANCIPTFCMVCPHSLWSCYFRGVLATCLPHKGGASR